MELRARAADFGLMRWTAQRRVRRVAAASYAHPTRRILPAVAHQSLAERWARTVSLLNRVGKLSSEFWIGSPGWRYPATTCKLSYGMKRNIIACLQE